MINSKKNHVHLGLQQQSNDGGYFNGIYETACKRLVILRLFKHTIDNEALVKIYMVFIRPIDNETLVKIYIFFIRPILACGDVVWGNCTNEKNSDLLEKGTN